MRPSRTVARAALTAALALGALPGLVGSHEPSPDRPIDAAAFRTVILATAGDQPEAMIASLDAARNSAGGIDASAKVVDRVGLRTTAAPARASAGLPTLSPSWSWRPPRYTVSGTASFYDNGTTAMRLPRGTVVVICGAAGCLQRTITDYGPAAYTGRIIDMYRPDFFAICGCASWSGLTQVTIRVY